MSFAAGALRGLTDPLLRKRSAELERALSIDQAIANIALQGFLDPSTDPELRRQYGRLLASMEGFEGISGLQIPDSPTARLRREFGPLLEAIQLAGGLGGAGLLTPEIAAQLERITGRPFFPRTTTTEPGPVITPAGPAGEAIVPRGALLAEKDPLTGRFPPGMFPPGWPKPVPGGGPLRRIPVPATEEVRGPPTTRTALDLSRFAPSDFMVSLPNGRQLRARELVTLIGTEGMRDLLLQGSGGKYRINVPGIGWIDIGDAAKVIGPEGIRGILGIGAAPSADQKSRDDAFTAYRAELDRSGDVKNAWLAAGRIRPDIFKPEIQSVSETLALEERDLFNRARETYLGIIARGGSVEEAYNAAFEIYPKFPAPATLPAKEGRLSPEQQVWADFFAGKKLSPEAQRFVDSKLRDPAMKDVEFDQAIRVLATLPETDLSATEEATRARALEVVARKLGVPLETATTKPKSFWQKLMGFIATGKWGGGEAPPSPTVSPEQQWARKQLDNFRQTGSNALGHEPKTRADFQRLFNIKRKELVASVPLAYWRALQVLISGMP